MSTITLKNTIYKNKLLLDFLDHATNLSSFHHGSSLDMIDDHFMMDRDLHIDQRKILVNALVRQYDSIGADRLRGLRRLCNPLMRRTKALKCKNSKCRATRGRHMT